MTTATEARAAAEEYLHGCSAELPPEDKLIIIEEQTVEHAWGWLFFYTSSLWHQTGEARYALAGNAPLIVERSSGRVLPTGTALPVEQYIANYERTGKLGA